MEFDILNELLTSSVAQLFTDNQKHQQMLRNSTQMGQDKNIPRQSSGLKDVMQTPEKQYGNGEYGAQSRPSPTAEKLANVLSGGGYEKAEYGAGGGRGNVGYGG